MDKNFFGHRYSLFSLELNNHDIHFIEIENDRLTYFVIKIMGFQLQKRVDRLTRELDVTSVQNEDLQMVLESLRTKFENLEMSKENEEKQKDLIIADLESKLENIVKEKDEEIEKLQNQVRSWGFLTEQNLCITTTLLTQNFYNAG